MPRTSHYKDRPSARTIVSEFSFVLETELPLSGFGPIAARPPHLEICLAYGEPCEASLTQFSKMLNVALVLLMLEAVHTDLV